MALQIKCGKCGEPMYVDTDTIEVANKHNIPLPSEHTVCPKDREVQPCYAVRTTITRYPSYAVYQRGERGTAIDLASFGGCAEGPSLNSVFDKIEAEVNNQWAQVRGMRTITEDGSEDDKENT